MTIERRREWGEPGGLRPDDPVASSDHELARLVARARAGGDDRPTIGLAGGDLCRTVGGGRLETVIRSEGRRKLPIDLGTATVDGQTHLFVAHVVVDRRPSLMPRWVAANAEWLGDWDLAPRAHPNDGLVDVLEIELGLRDQWRARRRAPVGQHVPHPRISQRRVADLRVTFGPLHRVRIDGQEVGSVDEVRIELEPDAFWIVV